jgi:Recombination endonuclease VII
MTRQTRCVDCNRMGRSTPRAALRPGPRCEEHHRENKRTKSLAAHAKRIEECFAIDAEIYWAIYEYQGGRCYICRRATGKRKRLAVDHDHDCDAGHDPKNGCHKCVRALLCGPCNKMIGYLDEDALLRAVKVLRDKPAQTVVQAVSSARGKDMLG